MCACVRACVCVGRGGGSANQAGQNTEWRASAAPVQWAPRLAAHALSIMRMVCVGGAVCLGDRVREPLGSITLSKCFHGMSVHLIRS